MPGKLPAMVGTISWFSELRRLKTGAHHHHHQQHHHHQHHHHDNDDYTHTRWIAPTKQPESLGILAFDTAKSMCRLVSLYKSLSDEEIMHLKDHVIPARGVTYLTSSDENFLLTLACAERLEELDRAASVVARLGLKCFDFALVRFDQVYKDLKNGFIDLDKLALYSSKEMQKSIDKMERFTAMTGELYSELQSLLELEASERKLHEWKKNNCNGITNYDLFDQKICNQRKVVRRLKETSLWTQTHDTIVSLMAKMVCVLFARICVLFGPYVSILPSKENHNHSHKKYQCSQTISPDLARKLFDDPNPQAKIPKIPLVRFLSTDSNIFVTEDVEARLGLKLRLKLKNYNQVLKRNNKVFLAAPPTTVGGSGLATRYANVILLAERYLNTNILVGDQARHNLYNMLPSSLKMYVGSKLRAAWREVEEEGGSGDELAEGWRDAVDGILEWLVPIAQDTLTWQQERNMEKQRFDSKPTVLLLQTLHYADLDKTEAAITEVLVGLSCIYWYENRRMSYVEMY